MSSIPRMSEAPEPVGSVEVALAHARRLLAREPRLAESQAREILVAIPAHPLALLILAAARRLQGDVSGALGELEPLARAQPKAVPVHLELAQARAEAGRASEAVQALRHVLALSPDSPDAWRLLADQLDLLGDAAGADGARARYLKAATRDPRLQEAASALIANDLPAADARLHAHLAAFPSDVAALRMSAEVAGRLRRYAQAEALLERCLELAPSFDAARHNLATVLNRQGKAAAARTHVERLLAREPRNPAYRSLQAAVLANLGDYAAAIAVYERVLAEYPRQPRIWMSCGHALKTSGQRSQSIAAYRRAIEQEPTLGEAYWSLANLKTFRFTAEDREAMRAALARTDLTDEDRLHFEFALGKALEDEGEFAQSFEHYDRGNALHRRSHPYDARDTTGLVERTKALFTPQFFAARAGSGAPEADPIFVLGLPRSGSTLIEQILASHSQVEGTMELPEIPKLARELARGDKSETGAAFLRGLEGLPATGLRELGERYLTDTRVMRRSGAPRFIDKMPNNWVYVGLIHLILPNARIIDARRHPLGCCFSCFKQHFARGQSFTYGLEDLGRYYRDYVDLMAHFDRVLPGRVHCVFYERLVEDPEPEVRALLAHCGLAYEEGCLRFHENARAVRTASSEQVRQPLFREGIDHWKNFEPWLGPLEQALGPVLAAYPSVPSVF